MSKQTTLQSLLNEARELNSYYASYDLPLENIALNTSNQTDQGKVNNTTDTTGFQSGSFFDLLPDSGLFGNNNNNNTNDNFVNNNLEKNNNSTNNTILFGRDLDRLGESHELIGINTVLAPYAPAGERVSTYPVHPTSIQPLTHNQILEMETLLVARFALLRSNLVQLRTFFRGLNQYVQPGMAPEYAQYMKSIYEQFNILLGVCREVAILQQNNALEYFNVLLTLYHLDNNYILNKLSPYRYYHAIMLYNNLFYTQQGSPHHRIPHQDNLISKLIKLTTLNSVYNNYNMALAYQQHQQHRFGTTGKNLTFFTLMLMWARFHKTGTLQAVDELNMSQELPGYTSSSNSTLKYIQTKLLNVSKKPPVGGYTHNIRDPSINPDNPLPGHVINKIEFTTPGDETCLLFESSYVDIQAKVQQSDNSVYEGVPTGLTIPDLSDIDLSQECQITRMINGRDVQSELDNNIFVSLSPTTLPNPRRAEVCNFTNTQDPNNLAIPFPQHITQHATPPYTTLYQYTVQALTHIFQQEGWLKTNALFATLHSQYYPTVHSSAATTSGTNNKRKTHGLTIPTIFSHPYLQQNPSNNPTLHAIRYTPSTDPAADNTTLRDTVVDYGLDNDAKCIKTLLTWINTLKDYKAQSYAIYTTSIYYPTITAELPVAGSTEPSAFPHMYPYCAMTEKAQEEETVTTNALQGIYFKSPYFTQPIVSYNQAVTQYVVQQTLAALQHIRIKSEIVIWREVLTSCYALNRLIQTPNKYLTTRMLRIRTPICPLAALLPNGLNLTPIENNNIDPAHADNNQTTQFQPVVEIDPPIAIPRSLYCHLHNAQYTVQQTSFIERLSNNYQQQQKNNTQNNNNNTQCLAPPDQQPYNQFFDMLSRDQAYNDLLSPPIHDFSVNKNPTFDIYNALSDPMERNTQQRQVYMTHVANMTTVIRLFAHFGQNKVLHQEFQNALNPTDPKEFEKYDQKNQHKKKKVKGQKRHNDVYDYGEEDDSMVDFLYLSQNEIELLNIINASHYSDMYPKNTTSISNNPFYSTNNNTIPKINQNMVQMVNNTNYLTTTNFFETLLDALLYNENKELLALTTAEQQESEDLMIIRNEDGTTTNNQVILRTLMNELDLNKISRRQRFNLYHQSYHTKPIILRSLPLSVFQLHANGQQPSAIMNILTSTLLHQQALHFSHIGHYAQDIQQIQDLIDINNQTKQEQNQIDEMNNNNNNNAKEIINLDFIDYLQQHQNQSFFDLLPQNAITYDITTSIEEQQQQKEIFANTQDQKQNNDDTQVITIFKEHVPNHFQLLDLSKPTFYTTTTDIGIDIFVSLPTLDGEYVRFVLSFNFFSYLFNNTLDQTYILAGVQDYSHLSLTNFIISTLNQQNTTKPDVAPLSLQVLQQFTLNASYLTWNTLQLSAQQHPVLNQIITPYIMGLNEYNTDIANKRKQHIGVVAPITMYFTYLERPTTGNAAQQTYLATFLSILPMIYNITRNPHLVALWLALALANGGL